MLMLGYATVPTAERNPLWVEVAAELTETCYKMYRIGASSTSRTANLAPEYVTFGPNCRMSIPSDAPWNMLRPEAVESLFYMHYFTGNPVYRRWGKDIFDSFRSNSKAKYGMKMAFSLL